MERFKKFLKIIEKNEGYFADIKNDKGGMTYAGIASTFHPDWGGWEIVKKHLPLKQNEKIEDPELDKMIEEFYEKEYWLPSKADQIEEDLLSLHYFDFAVNSGLRQAAKSLQKTIGVVVDGLVGPKTLSAVNARKWALEFISTREDFYKSIAKGSNESFLSGWLKRVTNTTKALV